MTTGGRETNATPPESRVWGFVSLSSSPRHMKLSQGHKTFQAHGIFAYHSRGKSHKEALLMRDGDAADSSDLCWWHRTRSRANEPGLDSLRETRAAAIISAVKANIKSPCTVWASDINPSSNQTLLIYHFAWWMKKHAKINTYIHI